jgi:hypothetical protein
MAAAAAKKTEAAVAADEELATVARAGSADVGLALAASAALAD